MEKSAPAPERKGAAWAKNLHNPGYDFDDRILATGAAIWVTLARKRLAA